MFSSDKNTPSLRTDFNRVVSGTFLFISAGLSGAFAALTGDMSYLELGALITGLGVFANYKLSSDSPSQQDCPEQHLG